MAGAEAYKDYLPPKENLQPTKSGRCSAVPPLPSVQLGKHPQGGYEVVS